MNQDDQSISTTSKWKNTPKKPLKWYKLFEGFAALLLLVLCVWTFLYIPFVSKKIAYS